MITRISFALVFGMVLLGMAGCTVGPNYDPPKSELVGPAFSGLPKDGAGKPLNGIEPGVEAVTRWWLVFGDEELNSLVTRAVRGNVDLKLAVSRVREARLQRTLVASGLGPQVEATAGYNRGRGSQNVILPFGGGGASSGASPAAGTAAASRAETVQAEESTDAGTAGAAGGAGASAGASPAASPLGQGGLPGVTTNLYQAGFDASWELDLFGGTRRAIESAEAGVEAAQDEQAGALVSLLGEVATSYMELRATQQRLRIARENLTTQQDTLGIVRAKFQNGFVTDLDVARQSEQVFSTQAVIPALEAAQRATEHALAFLLGEKPDALADELAPLPALPPLPAAVPVGVPSDLLRRRPDIRRAERRLAAATAQIGVATSDWWPKFSLTGAFGFDSSDLKNLGDWQSHYYSIAPGIRWPILDWGRVRANIHLANERQQQAFLGYTNAVAGALRDVEDALVGYTKEHERRAALAGAVEAGQRARLLAQLNYEHGVTDLLVSLEAERALLQTEDALAQSDGELRRHLVALYKALGGGWEESPPSAPVR